MTLSELIYVVFVGILYGIYQINISKMRKKKKPNSVVVPSTPSTSNSNRKLLLTTACNTFDLEHRYDLKGCLNDGKLITSIAKERGYEVIQLFESEMTVQNIKNALTEIGKTLKAGDKFIWHRSSHGTQKTDRSSDELDKKDEYICCSDLMQGGLLSDDDIYDLFELFDKNVQILTLGDTCHSSSSNRMFPENFDFTSPKEEQDKHLIRNRGIAEDELAGIYVEKRLKKITDKSIRVNSISGSSDNSTSADYYEPKEQSYYGALTYNLVQVLKEFPNGITPTQLHKLTTKRIKKANFEQVPGLEVRVGEENVLFF